MPLDLRCPVCTNDVDVVRDDYLREVVGWLRPQGTGGGQIVHRTSTGRIAHRLCVERGPSEQIALVSNDEGGVVMGRRS